MKYVLMRICITVFALFFSCTLSFAQSTGFGVGTVKCVEYDLLREVGNNGQILVSTRKELDISLIPSMSYFRFKSDKFFLLETGKFGFHVYDATSTMTKDDEETKIVNGLMLFEFVTSMRVAHSFKLKEFNRSAVYLGLGLNPQFTRIVNEPKVSSFKTASTELRTDFGLLMNTFFKLSDQIRLNLAIPINLWRYSMNWQRVHNPAIPISQQRYFENQGQFFPLSFELKLGLVHLIPRK